LASFLNANAGFVARDFVALKEGVLSGSFVPETKISAAIKIPQTRTIPAKNFLLVVLVAAKVMFNKNL
jgi:hypothetical protein